MPSINPNVFNLVADLSIRRQSSGFVDVEMLEPCATDYHVSTVTKDTFLPDIRIEFPEYNLDVVGRTFVVQVL